MELAELIEKSRVDNVLLKRGPRPEQYGSLALVGHHIIFSPKAEEHFHDELWLLHRTVDRVTVEPINKGQNLTNIGKAILILKCKNFMICEFEFNNINDCSAVARSVEKLSNLNNRDLDYPFYYRCPFKILDNGWKIYDIESEFTKLSTLFPDRFRITSVNKDFNVCSSYSKKLIVPKGIGDDYLRISATFRDGGRFPVLSYVDKHSKSIVVRTSQPLIGPTNRRCTEDEEIFSSYLGKNNDNCKGFIFDTRSKTILQAAKAKGGGNEPPFYYRSWTYINLGLPRISEIQESLSKLIEACNEIDSSFLSKVNSSIWLTHVSNTINASGVLTQSIKIHNRGATHIVHGGTGLDMTLILTSLSEFILNPDNRTIRGFQMLIEREWINGGHPFALRCAHSAYAVGQMTGPHESPVFLLFLDCIYQISKIYPTSVEFNEKFLIYLFEHAYASEFGTFLCNNDKERSQLNIYERTVSLWSYINHPNVLNDFINPNYHPVEQDIWPISASQSITIWERVYLRWKINWNDVDHKAKLFTEWSNKEKELQSKLAQLINQRSLSNMINNLEISEC